MFGHRDGGRRASGSDRRRPRGDRRRFRPGAESLEARQVLSAAPITAAVPQPPTPHVGNAAIRPGPVVYMPIRLPLLRAEAGRPFEGVVAAFASNGQVPPGRLGATIDWGDGRAEPAEVVANPWGGYEVLGAHTYDEDVRGLTSVRVDIVDLADGRWVYGAEQRTWISRPSPVAASLESFGVLARPERIEPAHNPAPARRRFITLRQDYRAAADDFSRGAATADQIRLLRRVKHFQDEQDKGFFEELGDNFVDSLPFT